MASVTTDRISGLTSSVGFKAPVLCATTVNITLSGEQSIDGVSCIEGDRVLVKNQSDTTQNGVYDVSTGDWVRAADFDGARDVVTGTCVFAVSGSTNIRTLWSVSTAGDPEPGAAMAFTQVTSIAGATGATGPQGPQGASGSIPIAAAAGTADAITANFTPDLTLTDKTLCAVVAGAANATTTPTFAPDGLTAHTITKTGGNALVAGEIAGALHVIFLEYNSANTRWELLNPAVTAATLGASKLAGGNSFTGAQKGGVTALTSTSSHIATNLSLNNDFSHTFTENTTLDNPTNITVGQKGSIFFTQHTSSPKTLALGGYFIAAGGIAQTVSATNSAKDVLYYHVLDSTHILYNIVKGAA